MDKLTIDKLTIDRSKWRNASRGEGQTCLLNDEGYMCCLGFACLALGATPAEILGILMPQGVQTDGNLNIFKSDTSSNDFAYSAAKLNDENELSDAEREARLIQLFGENGIALDFTGEYDGQIDN